MSLSKSKQTTAPSPIFSPILPWTFTIPFRSQSRSLVLKSRTRPTNLPRCNLQLISKAKTRPITWYSDDIRPSARRVRICENCNTTYVSEPANIPNNFGTDKVLTRAPSRYSGSSKRANSWLAQDLASGCATGERGAVARVAEVVA